MSYPAGTISPKTTSAKAPEDLWQAIRTIIDLQNQAPPLVSVSRDQDLPLSFTQERLWFLSQLDPGSAAYNIPFAFRIRGALNISALEQSLNEIYRRHEALRTTFSVDQKPVQAIEPAKTSTLEAIDLRQLSETERETRAQQLITESAQQAFNLNQGPLMRTTLVHLGDEDFILLLNVHHIVFDGWSEGVLWRELTTLYEAFSADQPSLPELPVQYADFAVWQRQWLQGEFLEALLAYWQQQLNNISELQLPTDRPRPSKPTRRSAYQKLVLPKELTEKLKAFSRQEGATLFATLLAAFKVLLFRYTEQDDLFVCSPIANRNRKELKNLIGYFVNLLVLRTDLSQNPSFRELLGRVRQVVSGAYAHQDLPVQQLVNRLDGVQLSLSQVMFVLQNTGGQSLKLADLTVEALEVDNGTADFDLSLSMVEEAGTLTGVLKYNTDLFEEATILRLLEHYQTVLEQLALDPDQPLSELLPLSEADRPRLRSQVQPMALSTNGGNYVEPRNPLELQLQKMWENILGTESIGIEDNFFELGGESLLAFRLLSEIEKTFEQSLPLTALLQAPTIEKLAGMLRDEAGAGSCSWLTPKPSDGHRLPFFCVPPAGNSGLGFVHLARHLGSDQPFYVPQPLGLEGETPPHNRVEDMAAHYIQEIRSIQPEGPYLIGGRCFGSIVAFEMALELSRQGQKVALLALIDGATPPNIYSQLRNTDGSLKTKSLLGYVNTVAYFCKSGQLPTFIKYKIRKIRSSFKKKGPKHDSQDPLFANVQQVFKSHREARNTYVPQGVYPGKIDIFASGTLRLDQQENWSELAQEVESHFVGGDHGSIAQEPYVRILAEKLRHTIDAAHPKEQIH